MEHSEERYIQGILRNDTPVLEEVYRRYLPAVFGLVRQNSGGTLDDAKDVFQESLVVIFRHAARPDFRLTSTFQAYLLGICRFVWLRHLKKNGRTGVTSAPPEGFELDNRIEQEIFETEKRTLYREQFARLGTDCRQVLQRFFDGEPLAQIAADMGFTPDYIKKKNKVCKEKLTGLIQNDPRFREIAGKIQHTQPPSANHDS